MAQSKFQFRKRSDNELKKLLNQNFNKKSESSFQSSFMGATASPSKISSPLKRKIQQQVVEYKTPIKSKPISIRTDLKEMRKPSVSLLTPKFRPKSSSKVVTRAVKALNDKVLVSPYVYKPPEEVTVQISVSTPKKGEDPLLSNDISNSEPIVELVCSLESDKVANR